VNKITSDHLARAAFVYVRQSTAYQVVNNRESQRRQYGLVERARQLGWDDVQVVDDDLGRSGGGTARPGFEKLLAAICEGKVGAVVSLEASRLARNGRDWHTLLEFCGLVGTLIVDEEAIYDPRSPNDRFVARYEGHDERDGVVGLASAVDRGHAPKSPARRASFDRRCRLHED
jgi:DNA invertase Pin-like site-specific DNA recombinase